jgi:hypothetical protein
MVVADMTATATSSSAAVIISAGSPSIETARQSLELGGVSNVSSVSPHPTAMAAASGCVRHAMSSTVAIRIVMGCPENDERCDPRQVDWLPDAQLLALV